MAPNVHAAQQALDVPSDDFGLWVCLHEATHRLQFTAVPWLRSYFAEEVSRLLSLAGDNRPSLDRLPELFRTLRESKGDSLAVVELLQGPEQRAVLDKLLALTTLLEGHADHVMDAVGPEVVPDGGDDPGAVHHPPPRRRAWSTGSCARCSGWRRRCGSTRSGSAFTKHVVLAVGMDGFNKVWESPETVPTRAELAEPGDWLRRVHDLR